MRSRRDARPADASQRVSDAVLRRLLRVRVKSSREERARLPNHRAAETLAFDGARTDVGTEEPQSPQKALLVAHAAKPSRSEHN